MHHGLISGSIPEKSPTLLSQCRAHTFVFITLTSITQIKIYLKLVLHPRPETFHFDNFSIPRKITMNHSNMFAKWANPSREISYTAQSASTGQSFSWKIPCDFKLHIPSIEWWVSLILKSCWSKFAWLHDSIPTKRCLHSCRSGSRHFIICGTMNHILIAHSIPGCNRGGRSP